MSDDSALHSSDSGDDGRDDDDDNTGDDWRKGKLFKQNGIFFTKEVWAVIAVEDWRDNVTRGTIEYLVR